MKTMDEVWVIISVVRDAISLLKKEGGMKQWQDFALLHHEEHSRLIACGLFSKNKMLHWKDSNRNLPLSLPCLS